MPWRIENCVSKYGKLILPNNVYVVGRLEGDIIINDKSVSRKHANIVFDCDKQSIFVEDLSKFGTSINDVNLKNKKGYIKDGDKVTFGAQPGVDFRFLFIKFDLIISTLINSDKAKLKDYTSVLGGRCLNEWEDSVRYLVMSNLKVTYKVICALIKQVPIVTINFIKEMHDFFTGTRIDEPKPESFLPPTTDVNIVDKQISFRANISRKTLFSNKTFYFMSAQKLSHLELAVTSASGKVVLITETDFSYTTTMALLKSQNRIVMYEPVENGLVTQVYSILKKLRKRPVIDSEIGFAVLYATTEEYCNPERMCKDSIYAETHLTQVLSVNPFHMNDNIPQDIQSNLSRKRSTYTKENSDEQLENVPKKQRMSPSKAKTPNKVYCNKDNAHISLGNDEDISYKKPLPNIFEEKKENILTSKTCVPKKNDYLQQFLRDNNNFSAETSSFKSRNPILPAKTADYDDEFDQIQVPQFGTASCASVTENKVFTLRQELEVSRGNLAEGLPCNTEPIKTTERFVELVPTTLTFRKTTESDKGNAVCKMTKFEPSVVVDMRECSRINYNFKTFKKVSDVYINPHPVAMEIFRRSV